MSGSPQLTSLSLAPFTVTDSTGSGAGWHVILTISDLTLGLDDIPASSYVMDAPTIAGVNGADTTNVTGFGSTGNFASGETIVSAAAGYGEGTYLVSPQPILLVVPADASAGTYAATALIDVESGP